MPLERPGMYTSGERRYAGDDAAHGAAIDSTSRARRTYVRARTRAQRGRRAGAPCALREARSALFHEMNRYERAIEVADETRP